MSIFFTGAVLPEMMRTRECSIPIAPAITVITSLFARPSTAGALTLHPTAFLHSLNPEGKQEVFEPAATSIVMMVPLSEQERAGVISVMSHQENDCRPALTTPDHQWHAAVLHQVFPIAGRCLSRNRVVPKLISRSSPVDHPGT